MFPEFHQDKTLRHFLIFAESVVNSTGVLWSANVFLTSLSSHSWAVRKPSTVADETERSPERVMRKNRERTRNERV